MNETASSPPGIALKGHMLLGGEPLFAPIDFCAPAGRWTCLLGPSGIGKSTLLRLVAGLETAARWQGKIAIGGEASADATIRSRQTAFMAQDDLLLPWRSVWDNITLGADLRGETPDTARAGHLLRSVGLEDHRSKKPAALSGGMRQRTALARTLMEDRPILLLDEPFSALDPRTRHQMHELTLSLLGQRTVLMVTHDPVEAARVADAAFVLSTSGLRRIDGVPDAPAPRRVDAEETLRFQGAIAAALLEPDA